MNKAIDHIAVCVCTFKRPYLLKRLLDALERQSSQGLFGFSVVIADNDVGESAKEVVLEYDLTSSLNIVYCVEPRQNIALARNMAIRNSRGKFIALIDDDEIPGKDWLYSLFKTCNTQKVDGVLGPVRPYFDHDPPLWVKKGDFFNRPEHQTGYRLCWAETRSGNVLFKREIIEGINEPFSPEFGSGSEDVDFFKRMIGNGKVFVWCQEAVVQELVTPVRCKRSFQIKMALLRGGNSLKHNGPYRTAGIVKSLIALPIYGISLPFLYLWGDHVFMKYLIKLSDHAGKILKLMGLNPIKARES